MARRVISVLALHHFSNRLIALPLHGREQSEWMSPERHFAVKQLSLSTWPAFKKLAVKQGGGRCMYYQISKHVGRGSATGAQETIKRRDKETRVRDGRS